MNIKHLTISLLVAAAASSASAVTLDFTNIGSGTDWPNQETFRTGSSVSALSSPSRVSLFATDISGSRNAFAGINSINSSDFDFITNAVTFTFSDVDFDTDVGNSYLGALGVANSSDADIISTNGVAEAVYFELDEPNGQIDLVQKTGSSNSTVATFSANSFEYDSLELELTGSTYSVSGTAVNGNTISGSGSLNSTITTTTWGPDFHIGLQSRNNFKTGDPRTATLEVTEVSAVPEPNQTALLFGVGVFLVAFRHSRKRA